MDLKTQADEIGIPVDTLKSMYTSFISGTPEDLQKIKTGISSKDIETVRSGAHHIKGAALNLDLLPLSEQAKSLEMAAKQEQWESIPGLFDELKTMYKTEEAEISKNL